MTLTLPVGLTVAPFSSQKSPETVARPVSALLVVVLPASAIARFRAVEPQLAVDRRDLSALEFEQRVVFEEDRPGLHPRRAEPRRVAGDVQRRQDGSATLDVDLAAVLLDSPPVPFTVKVSALVIPVQPTSTPLLLVLLLVSVPVIVRLLPPPPSRLFPSSSIVPLPVRSHCRSG